MTIAFGFLFPKKTYYYMTSGAPKWEITEQNYNKFKQPKPIFIKIQFYLVFYHLQYL